MEFYLRKARVFFRKNGRIVHTINPGEETDEQIQINFSVTKGLSSSANTALIDIWNLAEGTRNAMGKEFDGIVLEAGYIPPSGGSNVGIIFAGNLRDVEHKRDGDNIITTVQCGDGDAAIRRATINKTYPAGTKVGTIVDDIGAELEKEGISRGEVKGLDDLPPTKRPYSMCGSCTRELDRIGRSYGLHTSIQNETFEVIPVDGFLGGLTLLTPDTGLIGVPTITDAGCKVDCMMAPDIRPGRRVRIESQTLEMNSEGGVYRVGSCTYTGNNRNGEFKVSISAESITGKKVNEGPARPPIPTPRPEN
ncbi:MULTISPECIES: phage protein [unclassified Aurantimonas]|uniref:phage protein n=1 Tax=unclassified Aurantimonas TaxID=2638230 RepID=UPI002E17B4F9|nr:MULTISPECIES: hypothetical protein [unclassified Aurantimonas]MEC5289371.1 hypothetical protein [Aurantimonas sp. C2-3-R2]MEC5410451.1 hypothetical protein [Aurantimonas sp. C2-4-R8]